MDKNSREGRTTLDAIDLLAQSLRILFEDFDPERWLEEHPNFDSGKGRTVSELEGEDARHHPANGTHRSSEAEDGRA